MSIYYQDTGTGLSQQVATSGTAATLAGLLGLSGTAVQCNSVCIQNDDATNVIAWGYSSTTCVMKLAPASSSGIGGGSATIKVDSLADIWVKAAASTPNLNVAART